MSNTLVDSMRTENEPNGKKLTSNLEEGNDRCHFQYDARDIDRFRTRLRAENEAKFYKLDKTELAQQLQSFDAGLRNVFLDIDVTSLQSIQAFHLTSNLPEFFNILSDHISEIVTEFHLCCGSNSKPSIIISPLVAADFECNGLEWTRLPVQKMPGSITIGLCFSQMVVPTLYPTLEETPYSALILGNDDIWIPQSSQLRRLIRK